MGGLERGEDSEGAVEAPAVRDRIEMRTGPNASVTPTPEEVARLVASDLEACLPHPSGGKLVSGVLLRRVTRTRPTTDRVQLVEPLQKARGYNPNGLNGFGLVETMTRFVSR